ncbi:MAG: helix-hairpin-helix domain-containing protein [Planctomycetes bacterium]|nr:helix-hairpin-helix domain-containing protein [Planctomycetota bacterium]
MTICYWWYLGGHRGGLVEIERASPFEAKFLVDINRADWPEIIQLPGLGEILAQRILADRHDNGPFFDVDDLVRVNGIGVKTLEKIRPYLLPIPKDSDWAELEFESNEKLQ